MKLLRFSEKLALIVKASVTQRQFVQRNTSDSSKLEVKTIYLLSHICYEQ